MRLPANSSYAVLARKRDDGCRHFYGEPASSGEDCSSTETTALVPGKGFNRRFTKGSACKPCSATHKGNGKRRCWKRVFCHMEPAATSPPLVNAEGGSGKGSACGGNGGGGAWAVAGIVVACVVGGCCVIAMIVEKRKRANLESQGGGTQMSSLFSNPAVPTEAVPVALAVPVEAPAMVAAVMNQEEVEVAAAIERSKIEN